MSEIPLATSLAGCAFESYSNPSRIVGVQQMSHGHTTVSYISANFMREAFTGALEVSLLGGRCVDGSEGTNSWTVTVSTEQDHRNGSVVVVAPDNPRPPAIIYLHESS